MATKKKTEKKDLSLDEAVGALVSLSGQFCGLPQGEGIEIDTYRLTGSVIMDEVISEGKGIPRKKFIQITSPSNTGKTTIMLSVCKKACQDGEHCVYIDTEKGVNDSQLKGIGLQPFLGKSFFLFKINTFEECEQVLDAALSDEKMGFVVIDSITGLMSKSTLENSVTDVMPAAEARVNSVFLKKWKARLEMSKSTADFVFINQQRMKLNFRGMSTVAEAGGEAQKFYMDIRLRLKPIEKLTRRIDTIEGRVEVPYGANVQIFAPEKNRFGQPNIVGVLTIIFGKGISNAVAYQRMLMHEGEMAKVAGGYYTLELPDEEPVKLRQEAMQEYLITHMDKVNELIASKGGFKLVSKKKDGEEEEETCEVAYSEVEDD